MFVLSKGSIEVTINRIVQSRRLESIQPKVEHSQNRTAIIDGPSYQLIPFIWNIEAYCSVSEVNLIKALKSDQIKLTNSGQEGKFSLTDYLEQVVEPTPRLRKLAANSMVTTLPDGQIAYFAQFNVYANNLEIGPKSAEGRHKVNITLTEGDILPP